MDRDGYDPRPVTVSLAARTASLRAASPLTATASPTSCGTQLARICNTLLALVTLLLCAHR
jgi:hypothetical protein